MNIHVRNGVVFVISLKRTWLGPSCPIPMGLLVLNYARSILTQVLYRFMPFLFSITGILQDDDHVCTRMVKSWI